MIGRTIFENDPETLTTELIEQCLVDCLSEIETVWLRATANDVCIPFSSLMSAPINALEAI